MNTIILLTTIESHIYAHKQQYSSTKKQEPQYNYNSKVKFIDSPLKYTTYTKEFKLQKNKENSDTDKLMSEYYFPTNIAEFKPSLTAYYLSMLQSTQNLDMSNMLFTYFFKRIENNYNVNIPDQKADIDIVLKRFVNDFIFRQLLVILHVMNS